MKAKGAWAAIQPDELDTRGFDFVNDIQPGLNMVSVTWSCQLYHGSQVNDQSPGSRLVSSPIIEIGDKGYLTKTSQQISGCIPGCVYVLEALATFQGGVVISLWSYLPCQTAG